MIRDDLETARMLRANGVSQESIAEKLGRCRSYVQMLYRALDLSKDVREGFVNGTVTQADLLRLEKAKLDGKLTEVWSKIKTGEPVAPRYAYRSRYDIASVCDTTTNPVVKATLLWVLNQTEEIPN